jgi:hypothetical protein
MPSSHVPGSNVARGAEGDNDSSFRGGHRRGLAESNACTAPKRLDPWVPSAGPLNVHNLKREPVPYTVAASLKKPVPLNAYFHARLPRDVHVTRHVDGQDPVVQLNSKFCPEVQAATTTGDASDLFACYCLFFAIYKAFCTFSWISWPWYCREESPAPTFCNPYSMPEMPTYNS